MHSLAHFCLKWLLEAKVHPSLHLGSRFGCGLLSRHRVGHGGLDVETWVGSLDFFKNLLHPYDVGFGFSLAGVKGDVLRMPRAGLDAWADPQGLQHGGGRSWGPVVNSQEDEET